MNRTVVFNHHSLPFDSIEDADYYAIEFLKICLSAQRFGKLVILMDAAVDSSWFRIKLSKNYFWQDWYNKYKNDVSKKDQIRAFRSVSTRQPLLSIDDIKLGADLFNVYLNNGSGPFEALEAAEWNEAPLISYPTRVPWTQTPIHAILVTLGENGNLDRSEINIINLYSYEVYKDIEKKLLVRLNEAVNSGKDLFKNSKILFPYLSFCGNSNEQLQYWSGSLTILRQVKESLIALNDFTDDLQQRKRINYTHHMLVDYGMSHSVSGESDSVKQNKKLRSYREFYLPNGKKELFENHVKLSKGYRIHFFVDFENNVLHIGHIGPHLPLS